MIIKLNINGDKMNKKRKKKRTKRTPEQMKQLRKKQRKLMNMACPPKVVPSVKLVVVQTERNREYDT